MSLKPTKHNSLEIRSPGFPRECDYCFPRLEFYDASELCRHLRTIHSSKEGGSYICRYGENNVCQTLPPEGVSDVDYEAHIRKIHCFGILPESTSPSHLQDNNTKFTINSYTQNLSAVLSDPNAKKSEIAGFFSRHWGDTFVQPVIIPPTTILPKADSKFMRDYIKSTAKEYKKYRISKKTMTRLQHPGLAGLKSDANDLPPVFVDPSFLLSHGPTFKAIFTVPEEDEDDPLRLKDDKNPFTGDADNPPIAGENLPARTFRNYDELHQHLESLHDVVDNRLAAKLVNKSDSFWKIVHSYGGLNEDLSAAMSDVKDVRNSLHRVSDLIIHQTNRIIKLYELRERKRLLLSKLRDISCLKDAQSTVQMLLNQNDYPKVIDCIETSQEVLDAELGSVNCFRHLGMQLDELYGVVGKMMHEEFAQLIQREFAFRPDIPEGTLQFEGELSSILIGLMKMRKFTFMRVVRSEISEAIKGILRQVLKQRIIESGLDLTRFDPSLNNLAEPLRALSTKDWLKTLTAVSAALLSFCTKLQTFQDLLAQWADHIASSYCSEAAAMGKEAASICQPTRSRLSSDSGQSDNEMESGNNFNFNQQLAPSSDPSALIAVEVRSQFHLIRVASVIAEYGHFIAQQRLCRLLVARAKEPSTDNASSDEIVECRNILKNYLEQGSEKGWNKNMPVSSSPLFTCMQKVSVDFLNRFHQIRRTKMGEALDVELWKASPIQPSIQAMANRCAETNKLRKVSEAKGEAANSIILNGEEYVVVGSAITFLEILAEYCACLEVLPSFTSDLLSRIIELLKAFNSRCCQLILGAGALQLVGLRTISVKNLALASRSLQMVVCFIPFISSEVESYLKEDQKHLMRHFKQVFSDYSDHTNEITAKLIAVIDHHTATCLSSWELKGSMPSSSFQQICRHLQKFHNGLVGIIPSEQIRNLFETVNSNFKVHIKQQLAKIGVTPHDSLTYGLVCQDYAFYVQSLKAMESCGDLHLETLNEIVYGR